ncbi:MAG: aspartyl/glutamyl-tRNA amidotransferase subunit C, partial [Cohaesibacter sp.]|nr:aspartyl/glutamyl-tRNA amidotransferase subunit C [Cohaesibacter sp.]
MSIDKDTVKRVARLARVAVTDDEAESLKGELNSILDWVELLNEVD